MSNLSDFFGGIGGGLTPKFQDFTASGNFTPTQGLIDAGGYIEVFLVGGGASNNLASNGGSGGETILTQMYLSTTSSVSVTIGAGASGAGNGSSSSFDGSSAGGVNVTALGGISNGFQSGKLGAGWGAEDGYTAGSGVFGYGAGGRALYGGISIPKANSGQGGSNASGEGTGYCLIKWYE